jgi:hypothetical protein
MPRNLQEVKDSEKAKRGTEQRILGEDLDTQVVYADTYRDIFQKRSTESAKFYLGHGMRSRDDPNAGYFYAAITASGTGALTDGADIGGKLRFVVYADSEDEVPIVGSTYPLRELRDAATDSRTERPVLPLQLPGAGKDKAIAVQLQTDSASDGAEVAQDSDVSIPYTQILA